MKPKKTIKVQTIVLKNAPEIDFRFILDIRKDLDRVMKWIDLWETYDSGWNKYRKGKKR